MSFLDLNGLEKVWQKIVGGFLQKTDTLTDEQIESATTGGGNDSQSLVGGMTVKDYIDTKLENIEADTISANEISVTSGNSLILGGDSYDDETEEDDWFEIKCPKRPYFNINGNIYNLPWEEQNGVDVDLCKQSEIFQRYRIRPQGTSVSGGYSGGYHSDDPNLLSNIVSADTSVIGYYDNSSYDYFSPVHLGFIIENFNSELTNSSVFRVFYLRYGNSRSNRSTRWKVPYFDKMHRERYKDWWEISTNLVSFFEGEYASYNRIDAFGNVKVGAAIFQNMTGADNGWKRVSNIAAFKLTRYKKPILQSNFTTAATFSTVTPLVYN